MDLTFLIALVASVLAAAVGILHVVAPKTVNTTDDAVLARLETLEEIVRQISGK